MPSSVIAAKTIRVASTPRVKAFAELVGPALARLLANRAQLTRP